MEFRYILRIKLAFSDFLWGRRNEEAYKAKSGLCPAKTALSEHLAD